MITRHAIADFSAFQTFSVKRTVPHLDIESKDGDLSLLDRLPEHGLAIVGSRYPQLRSVQLLEKTLGELSNTSLVIISGLARGIDSRAHEIALDCGLKTIGILGCGIDLEYPIENAHLRRRIIQNGGLVISQFERNEAPLKHHFLIRNRLIAGLSKATWVVEAAAISGTLKEKPRTSQEVLATERAPGEPAPSSKEEKAEPTRTR